MTVLRKMWVIRPILHTRVECFFGTHDRVFELLPMQGLVVTNLLFAVSAKGGSIYIIRFKAKVEQARRK